VDDDGTQVRCARGPVAVVTLDGPARRNALDRRAIGALSQLYADLDADDSVRAIVLTGAGTAFCSGADLSRRGGAFQAPRDPARYRSSPPRPLAFQLRKPVVAAVNGHAVGFGMSLALHCDARIMSLDGRWGVVQVRRGVVPDALAHWTVTRAVGTARAAEILLTGTLFTGEDALRLGVANRVLPAPEVLPAALALAGEMAAGSPLSVALTKRILWSGADAGAARVDDLESEAHRILMGRPDALEGGRAAFEHRAPRWTSTVADWPTEGSFAAPEPLLDDY
jgi:enoyl-CoA hydratase/carnithine racemase